jgi:hypothetical protein
MRYEFKVSSSEKRDIEVHARGPDYLSCIGEIVVQLRNRAKYGNTTATTWDEVYSNVLAILREYNIDPSEG